MICLVVFPVSTSAQENSDHVIRVGSFEETYNVVNEKGERSGYGYEYLQDIAGYAGWTYKYITSDWKNCFTQLENGEIDILGGISYTDERAENMLFSDMFIHPSIQTSFSVFLKIIKTAYIKEIKNMDKRQKILIIDDGEFNKQATEAWRVGER